MAPGAVGELDAVVAEAELALLRLAVRIAVHPQNAGPASRPGLAVGLAGFSAIGQGITSAGAIAAAARNPDSIGRSLVFAAMSETFAIFGLLIAILILFGLGLFQAA